MITPMIRELTRLREGGHDVSFHLSLDLVSGKPPIWTAGFITSEGKVFVHPDGPRFMVAHGANASAALLNFERLLASPGAGATLIHAKQGRSWKRCGNYSPDPDIDGKCIKRLGHDGRHANKQGSWG